MMTSQKNKNGNSNTMILVDAEKLSQALTTTFNGVAMIFESLGIESGLNGEITVNPSIAEDTEQKPSKTRKGKTASEPKEETAVSRSEASPGEPAENAANDMTNAAPIAADSSDKHTEKNAEKSPEDVVEETAESTEHADTKNPPKPVSSVSLDDITKIIVQKIKKERSNNEKIGQILKTYGVVKVSELPEEKYEAFLTDLSQL